MTADRLAGLKAVYFDAVGTVLHPDPGVATVYAAAAARFGLPADPDAILARFRAAFRREEAADEQAGWVTSEPREVERWRAIVGAALPGAPDECFAELYAHFARPDAWAVPAGATEPFARLASRGLRLGLASNFDARLAPIAAGQPELAPLRGRLVVSSAVGVRKPGAGFFAALIENAGCQPDEILLVGDDYRNDYVGATAAGLRAVLLDPMERHPHVTDRVTTLGKLAGWFGSVP